MGHMLFTGLPGAGKTSTAKATSGLSKLPFIEINPESFRSPEDLARIFSKFPGDGYDPHGEKIATITPPILFIDEAHRLSRKAEELIGIAMENRTHTYSVGRGRKRQTITDWVPEFTLICATTKEGELSKPFRDRFKFVFVFGEYTLEESKQIVELHAERKGLAIDPEAVTAIAKRGRGTPRILVRYLDNINDSKIYLEREKITLDLAEAQFILAKIDPIGLTESDITILKYLYESDVPIGIDSLAVTTNLDPRTISEVNEPYLIRLSLMERSKGGRIITAAGEKHLIEYKHVEKPEEDANSRSLKKVNA
jgi:Holliday junction DNA helicase RuvB